MATHGQHCHTPTPSSQRRIGANGTNRAGPRIQLPAMARTRWFPSHGSSKRGLGNLWMDLDLMDLMGSGDFTKNTWLKREIWWTRWSWGYRIFREAYVNETNGIGTPPYTGNREAFRCQWTHLAWYTYEFAWAIMQRTLHYWLTAWSYLIMERLSECGIHNSPKMSEESLTLIIYIYIWSSSFLTRWFCGFAKIISEVIEIPKSFPGSWPLPFFFGSSGPPRVPVLQNLVIFRWSQMLGGEKLRPPRRSRPNLMCWESTKNHESRRNFLWTTDDTYTIYTYIWYIYVYVYIN